MALEASEDASVPSDDLTVIALRLQYDPSGATPLTPTPLVVPAVPDPIAIAPLR